MKIRSLILVVFSLCFVGCAKYSSTFQGPNGSHTESGVKGTNVSSGHNAHFGMVGGSGYGHAGGGGGSWGNDGCYHMPRGAGPQGSGYGGGMPGFPVKTGSGVAITGSGTAMVPGSLQHHEGVVPGSLQHHVVEKTPEGLVHYIVDDATGERTRVDDPIVGDLPPGWR